MAIYHLLSVLRGQVGEGVIPHSRKQVKEPLCAFERRDIAPLRKLLHSLLSVLRGQMGKGAIR